MRRKKSISVTGIWGNLNTVPTILLPGNMDWGQEEKFKRSIICARFRMSWMNSEDQTAEGSTNQNYGCVGFSSDFFSCSRAIALKLHSLQLKSWNSLVSGKGHWPWFQETQVQTPSFRNCLSDLQGSANLVFLISLPEIQEERSSLCYLIPYIAISFKSDHT